MHSALSSLIFSQRPASPYPEAADKPQTRASAPERTAPPAFVPLLAQVSPAKASAQSFTAIR